MEGLGYPERRHSPLSGQIGDRARDAQRPVDGALTARLGQDEKQICRWERGRLRPHPWIAGRLDLDLRALSPPHRLEGRNWVLHRSQTLDVVGGRFSKGLK